MKHYARRAVGLDSSDLICVDPNGNMLADAEAVQALEALCAHASEHGFTLKPCSAYRSFERQFLIVNDKFAGRRAVLDADEKPLDIKSLPLSAQMVAILRFSALPGFSRHHFGTDFDIYAQDRLPPGQKLELTAREYARGSYFYEFGEYLNEALGKFGFIRPFTGRGLIAAEPWHISYFPKAERLVVAFDSELALSTLRNTKASWADEACVYAQAHVGEFFS